VDDLGLVISLAVFGVGALFLALAGIMFRIRAIANRKAWDGGTVPLTVIGLIVAAVGLALIYFNYPA
jgi:hypothetical protein